MSRRDTEARRPFSRRPVAAVTMFVLGVVGCTPAAAPCSCPASRPAPQPVPEIAGAAPCAQAALEATAIPTPPSASPTTSEAVSLPEDVHALFAIDVSARGALWVDGKRVADLAALGALARAKHDADPDARAIVRADRDAAFQSVIRVVDTLKSAGIGKIAFGVTASAP